VRSLRALRAAPDLAVWENPVMRARSDFGRPLTVCVIWAVVAVSSSGATQAGVELIRHAAVRDS